MGMKNEYKQKNVESLQILKLDKTWFAEIQT